MVHEADSRLVLQKQGDVKTLYYMDPDKGSRGMITHRCASSFNRIGGLRIRFEGDDTPSNHARTPHSAVYPFQNVLGHYKCGRGPVRSETAGRRALSYLLSFSSL